MTPAGGAQPVPGMAAQDKRLVGVRPNGQDMPHWPSTSTTPRPARPGRSGGGYQRKPCPPPGAAAINDFIDRGRVKKVHLQADAPARMTPEDLGKWYVRNAKGEMVPFSAFAKAHWTYGSPRLERFNGQSSMQVLGAGRAGLSSGEGDGRCREIAAKLPAGSATNGRALSLRNARAAPRRRRCLRSRSWWCSCAGGAVRELVDSLRGHAGGAAGCSARSSPPPAAGCPTTSTSRSACCHHRPVVEERDPDRGIRQGADGRGHALVEATLEAVRMRLRPTDHDLAGFRFGVLPLATATARAPAARMPSVPACSAAPSSPPRWGSSSYRSSLVIKRIFRRQAEGAGCFRAARHAGGQAMTQLHLDHHRRPTGRRPRHAHTDYERPAAPVPTSFPGVTARQQARAVADDRMAGTISPTR